MSNKIYIYIYKYSSRKNIELLTLWNLYTIIDDLHYKHKIKILYNDKLLNDQKEIYSQT